ncbi:MAG: glycosyltransferase family 2 protein, partial [Maritimibacter sp.]|nr:glycosyltransferase family 2 protein [Maritimibacter sp.]
IRPPARADHGGALPAARVIVATRNRPETLAECLDTLLAQDYPAAEIVVVDNAPSDDSTRAMIARRYAGVPAVRYVREDRAGLGRAHNAGLSGLTAPVVAITDDDVLVDPGWLRRLCAAFAEDPRTGCVTGLILPRELETRAQYWTECHGGFGKGFDRQSFDMDGAPSSGPLFPYAAGSFGSGANMAFSKVALERIGGFDPALGAGTVAKGGDDLAAFVQVIRSGFRLVYEPGAIVWHLHRRGEDGMARQAYFYGIGLGAYLTKMVVDDPKTALHFLRALPPGLAHMFAKSSAKNARLPVDFPARLRQMEQLGMLVGVPSYLVSRRRARAGAAPARGSERGAVA